MTRASVTQQRRGQAADAAGPGSPLRYPKRPTSIAVAFVVLQPQPLLRAR